MNMIKLISTFVISFFITIVADAQEYEQKEEDHTHTYSIPVSTVFSLKNWEKKSALTDKTVNLYERLDEGYIIIQEYFMIDCRPCITAGKSLEKIVKALKEKYPNRILYYQTVYENKSTPKQAVKWVKDNNFTPDEVFIQGGDEVGYYGGMGMPTIVILGGGAWHKGYYKKQGYSLLDNGNINAAVRKAISVTVPKEKEKNK